MRRVVSQTSTLIVVLLFFFGCSTSRNVCVESVSPVSFGLLEAKTDIERYYVLKRTHEYAILRGLVVDYHNIGTIEIEIPKDGMSIPLGLFTDFSGTVLRVRNNSKHLYLFNYAQNGREIYVPASQIDKGRLSRLLINKGTYLLSIEDENPWVENRTGYKYGHQRKDIVLIKNRKAQNTTVMPYDNPYSRPKCIIYTANKTPFLFTNLVFERAAGNRFRTNLVQVKGLNNVTVQDVEIITPESDLTGDAAISIQSCTNVTFRDIKVDGTYSKNNDSGYAFSLNNVWNFEGSGLSGKANWGLFGDNNVNKAHLSNCELNRFDIHCYGRDVSFDKCTFQGMANQFSSLYGTLSFDHCRFIDATPVKIEYTYNCYTPFDLVINDCSWVVSRYRNEIVYVGYVDDVINTRPELAEKSWPNVSITNFSITTAPEVSNVMLFYIKGNISEKQRVEYISDIQLDNVQIRPMETDKKVTFVITNGKVISRNDVRLNVRRSVGVTRNQLMREQ